MLLQDVEELAQAMADVSDAVREDLASGDLGDEDDFSSQLVGRLKQRIGEFSTASMDWTTQALTEADDGPASASIRLRGRHLTSRGPGAEETLYGADIIFVLDVDSPFERFSKGILIQAKMAKKIPDYMKDSEEARKLKKQCELMLDITSSSYVFTYGESAIGVFSAADFESMDIFTSAPRTPLSFYTDFIKCWIGDPRIRATDKASLAAIRAGVMARSALLVTGRSKHSDFLPILPRRRRIKI